MDYLRPALTPEEIWFTYDCNHREHQWAEPLGAGLRSYLRAGISEALGYDVSAGPADLTHWDYTVDVYVDRLHGTMAGTAMAII